MRRFYGVYLESEAISTVLDLIRFLGEPDGIRLSHITLRGPYGDKIKKSNLDRFNDDPRYDWLIDLVEPQTFFTVRQSTVVIAVDLRTLEGLVYKPDFPDSTPHITLYDGPDRAFATELYEILADYKWERPMRVSRLREISRSDKIDEILVPIFKNFVGLFQKLVGPPKQISLMRAVDANIRLSLIRAVLERCVDTAPLPRETDGVHQAHQVHRAIA